MTESEEKLFRKMKETIAEQDAYIKKLMQAPKRFGVVVKVKGDRAVYTTDSGLLEAEIPSKLLVKAGHFIKVDSGTGMVVQVDDDPVYNGPVARFRGMLSPDTAEVEMDTGKIAVAVSPKVKRLKPDHRVQLDVSETMIVRSFGSQEETFKTPPSTGVTWDDIGGLEDAKIQLKEAIELPIVYPEILAKYNQKPVKGIMLYGPPGCGKTMLAKAAVSAIAQLHGADAVDTGFIYVKGPEILSKWVGESEQIIRSLFTRAREHHADNGYPAVVFIDEAESVLGRRGSGRSSDMERTIVPQFLSEMDGLSSEGAPVVLMATNRPDSLDPAVVRDGRVDRKIKIERPGPKDIKAIFELNLKGKPIDTSCSGHLNLALASTEELLAEHHVLYSVVCSKGEKHSMTLASTVNGAMVAGIVAKATFTAMRRDMQSKKVQGIRKEDILMAVKENVRQMADIDLSDELKEFVEKRNINPKHIEKVI